MEYLKLSLFVLVFVFCFNIFKLNESFADIAYSNYRYIKNVWIEPYPDEKRVGCNLFFASSHRRYVTNGQLYPNLFKHKKQKTQECTIEILLPGPCDYSCIVYDENDKVVLKEKGSNEKFGPREFVSDNKFKLSQMEINQRVDYKIELNVTLYNYKKAKNDDYNEKQHPDLTGFSRGLGIEKVYGDPRYKYILVDKNGKKIKNIYAYKITRHDNGYLVQQK